MLSKFTYGIYSFFLIFLTSFLAHYFTEKGISAFYGSLALPQHTPENHYFSYAWALIYFLLFISFFLVLTAKATHRLRSEAHFLFVCQLFLQILWTFSFFYTELLTSSAIVIVLLDILVALMMHTFFFISKTAFILTVPYMLWLLFATYLNIFIVMLN